MTETRSNGEALDACVGRKICKAASSLNSFAVELEGKQGLLMKADSQTVSLKMIDNQELPRLSEAVCTVDWSWICGSVIESARSTGSGVELTLSPAGPLSIDSRLWQGDPFLAFQPYKPAKK